MNNRGLFIRHLTIEKVHPHSLPPQLPSVEASQSGCETPPPHLEGIRQAFPLVAVLNCLVVPLRIPNLNEWEPGANWPQLAPGLTCDVSMASGSLIERHHVTWGYHVGSGLFADSLIKVREQLSSLVIPQWENFDTKGSDKAEGWRKGKRLSKPRLAVPSPQCVLPNAVCLT